MHSRLTLPHCPSYLQTIGMLYVILQVHSLGCSYSPYLHFYCEFISFTDISFPTHLLSSHFILFQWQTDATNSRYNTIPFLLSITFHPFALHMDSTPMAEDFSLVLDPEVDEALATVSTVILFLRIDSRFKGPSGRPQLRSCSIHQRPSCCFRFPSHSSFRTKKQWPNWIHTQKTSKPTLTSWRSKFCRRFVFK